MNTEPTLTELLRTYSEHDLKPVPLAADALGSPERIEAQLQEGVKRGQVWIASEDILTDDEDDNDENEEGDYDLPDSLYVMIVDVNADDPRLVTVIPLSDDLRVQTDDALVIEKGSPLEQPTLAWPRIKAIIPMRLLSTPLKQFKPATVDAIVSNDVAIADPDDTVTPGTDQKPEDFFLPENREDIVTTLLKWHAQCFTLPKLHSKSTLEYSTSEDMAQYNEALKTVLHLTPAQRIAISRGRQLTPEQQQKMADAGYAIQPRKQETIADDYLIMAEQPQWYEAAAAIAQANARAGVQDDPRVKLAHKAQFELAARTSGHGEEAIRGAFRKAAESVIEENDR